MRKKSAKKFTLKLSACQNRKKEPSKKAAPKSIKKQDLKTMPNCRVTFRLPKDAAPEAQNVTIVGDFNNWNITETPLKRLKNGDFKVTLELPCNREYRFRYIINANQWENDECIDKYTPIRYGDDD
jgi:1,4-alpha-glucan branching enzyme